MRDMPVTKTRSSKHHRPVMALTTAMLFLALSAGQALAESAHGGASNDVQAVSRVPTCMSTRGQGSASTLCAASLWRPSGNGRRRSGEGTPSEPLARILVPPQHHAGGGTGVPSGQASGGH